VRTLTQVCVFAIELEVLTPVTLHKLKDLRLKDYQTKQLQYNRQKDYQTKNIRRNIYYITNQFSSIQNVWLRSHLEIAKLP